MSVLVLLVVALIVGLLAFGMWKSFAWDPDDRRLGLCTAVWAAVALYLYLTEWLPSARHEPYGLVTIGLLAAAGYVSGRVLVWLTRWEWSGDEISRKEDARVPY